MEIAGIVQRVHFTLQFLNLDRKLISLQIDFPFLVKKVPLSSSVEISQRLYKKTFSVLPFPDDHSNELFEELFLFSCIFISERASDNIWFLCSSRSNLVRYSASESLNTEAFSP